MREELVRDIHRELLQEIRGRERGIWKFWTIMISALGTLVAGKYFEKYSSEYHPPLLLIGVGFALILLFWGVWLVLTYGYHYRMFQKVLWNIENEQCLSGGIIPSGWDPCRKEKWDLPMLYKVHLYAFNIAIALVATSSLFVVSRKPSWYWIAAAFLAVSIILCFFFRWYSQRKLKSMKEDLCSEEVQQCREGDRQVS